MFAKSYFNNSYFNPKYFCPKANVHLTKLVFEIGQILLIDKKPLKVVTALGIDKTNTIYYLLSDGNYYSEKDLIELQEPINYSSKLEKIELKIDRILLEDPEEHQNSVILIPDQIYTDDKLNETIKKLIIVKSKIKQLSWD